MSAIPATVLTGFLGAGKTTLLQYILKEQHGYKIAVIENEFGEVAIDDALLGDRATQITTLSNGCICCSSQNDLSDALYDLLDAKDDGLLEFDYLIIECTGMADPGPIIQTFFSSEVLAERYLLDGVITLVDAVHAMQQLDQFTIAQAQIGYADRLLITKTDVNANIDLLEQGLRKINVRAPIYKVIQGQIDLSLLFNIEGFILNDQLTITTPVFNPVTSAQQTNIQSLVVRLEASFELADISDFMDNLLATYGDQILRYKGILSIVNEPCRLLFQGVQKLYSADWDREWLADEKRESVLVFIGLNLPEQEIRDGFANLIAKA